MPRYDGPQQLRNAEPEVITGFRDALNDTHADERLAVALFAAGIVEANLKNPAGGDRDSVGVLQQRGGWGPVAARMGPYRAALAFLADATGRVLPKRPGLTPGVLAQAVQRSAYPDRYTEAEPAARYVIAHTLTPPAGDGGDVASCPDC